MHFTQISQMKPAFLLFSLLFFNVLVHSQTKDTIVYKDYYILLNGPISRTVGWDLGIERIKPLRGKLSYAVQFSVRGGKWYQGRSESYTNPRFISLCVQPFHLLVGKRWKFETGLSCNLQVYRTDGHAYPAVKSFSSYQDMLVVIYSLGLRYTFQKPQLSLKLIAGPGYGINLQTHFSQFIQSQTLELGLSWRLRHKQKKLTRP